MALDEMEIKAGKRDSERRTRIVKKSDALNAKMDVKTFFTCQYCGTAKIKDNRIKTQNSLSQHESWCKQNPNSRRKKRKSNLPSIQNPKPSVVPEITEYAKLVRIRDLTKKLNLTKEQILILIESEIENEGGLIDGK